VGLGVEEGLGNNADLALGIGSRLI
jgi:hypothetical protein